MYDIFLNGVFMSYYNSTPELVNLFYTYSGYIFNTGEDYV